MDQQLYSAPCGYFLLGEDGMISQMNKTFLEMTGFSEGTPVHIHRALTVASKLYFQTYFLPLFREQETINEMYLTLQTPNGRLPILLNAAPFEGNIACTVMHMTKRNEYENRLNRARQETERVVEDMNRANTKLEKLIQEYDRKRQELQMINESLERLALTDPLTGLKNRRYLTERLELCIHRANESDWLFSVLLVDIDFFKRVNDTYGHDTGDLVLKELAAFLKAGTRKHDIVGRMGGEEFMLILAGANKETALDVAERIRESVELGTAGALPITISIGVTSFQQGDTPELMYSRADQALYTSKETGRNRVTYR